MTVDASIPGQNWVCLSFVSPEKVLPRKDKYLMQNFLKHALTDKDPEGNLKATPDNVCEMFDDFMYANEEKLTQQFVEDNDFLTSVRGIKVRGTYETRREAEVRAKVLQKRDRAHHVFVGQVGYWLPWDPNPDLIEKQEHANDDLNSLVREMKKNQEQKDEHYEMEKQDKINKAREESERVRKEQIAQRNIGEAQRMKEEDDHKRLQEEAKEKIPEMREMADEKDRALDATIHPKEAGSADPWLDRKENGEDDVSAEGNGETMKHGFAKEENVDVAEVAESIF